MRKALNFLSEYLVHWVISTKNSLVIAVYNVGRFFSFFFLCVGIRSKLEPHTLCRILKS